MSREIKRVPLDFDAPIGETWAPLLLPAELALPACDACHGNGTTATRDWLLSIATLIAQLGDDCNDQARGRGMHPYLAELHNRPGTWIGPRGAMTLVQPRPTGDARDLVAGLVGRTPDGMFGSSSSDWARIANRIIEAAGLNPESWGICPGCNGEGHAGTPEQVAACDAWEPAEIPTGEGWQLWQTVSEGGPVSPVFESAEDLARWMASSGEASSIEVARRFIEAGWAPSGGSRGGVIVSGVELIGGAA